MIDQLIQVIGEEALLFEEFLDLLDRQKQMLVANDVNGLNEVTAAQQKKLIESQKLHRRREKIVAAIKATNALDGDVTLTRLLGHADESQAAQLRRLRETILSLNDSILRARNTNAMLLNRSREYIARTMSMLSRINNPDNTYDKRGTAGGDRATVAVDRRI